MKDLYAANLKTMGQYNCNTELIRMQQAAFDTKNYGPVIRKATQCLDSFPSGIGFEIRADAYVFEGKFDLALKDFGKAIQFSKADIDSTKKLMEWTGDAFKKNYEQSREYLAMVYNNRAELYMILGDKAKAIADLKEALLILPDNYSYNQSLKNIDAKIAEKQKAESIAHPKTSKDFVIRGDDKNRLGKYQEALAEFAKALELDPKNADVYLGRGNSYRDLEPDGSKAIAEYGKAIALNAKSSDAYIARGYLHRNIKNYDAALSDFNAAIKIKGNTAGLLDGRGSVYLNSGKYEEALKDYRAALKVVGDDKYESYTAQIGEGDALRYLGRDAEAMTVYGKVIDAGKDDWFGKIMITEAYVSRGKIYASKGLKQQAAADFNAALTAVKDHADAKAELAKLNGTVTTGDKSAQEWALQGRQQMEKKQFAEAITSLSAAIAKDASMSSYFLLRGLSYAYKGDLSAAKPDFDQAIKLTPKEIGIYGLRGAMYMSKGMKTEAAQDFRRVLEIDPSNERAKAALKQLGY